MRWENRPDWIGPYRLEAQVGAGGMGMVFRATDTKLNRLVAIKILADDLSDEPARRRFQREAQLASSLNHPHILTVHDVGEIDGRQYLVTEFVDGGTLKDWAAGDRRTWRQIVELLVGVADGLATAHEAGVLHRDIKPDNILISRGGYAKLADFGLAKLAEHSDPHDKTRTWTEVGTRPGIVVGTIAYMSPEQASGKPLDARSDVFSFGVVLYELLVGHRPFAGANDLELLKTIIHGRPQPLAADVPVALRSIVEKALERDSADRYQSMREMVVDLRRFVRPSEEVPTTAPRPLGRRWALAAGVSVVTILAMVVAMWLWAKPRGRPPSRTDWVQLTKFPDSVTQPALSADGRLLAFIRGPGSFSTTGQIYVKMLPDGEPKPLTNDSRSKMSPVFSPDGSRVAYTTEPWDTWVVPVLGGEPRRWLPNASGLAWSSKGNIVFSEIINRLEGNHMKIVAAEESRAGERDLYVPSPTGAMAHRSFPSPDGSWVMLAEMSDRGVWHPCRVIPADGTSTGRRIGPPDAACWFAAWSPDGKWMYVSASSGGAFHIWRQRFSDSGTFAAPEQITSGPTSEEGIAMAPDGRSLVTAVGLQQRAIWVHDSQGERQVSVEGYASQPTLSPDGKTLFYLVQNTGSKELWFADLSSGRTEALLPNFPLVGDGVSGSYDLSADGRQVVVQGRDGDGKARLWLAPVDRRYPPRPIPNVEGDGPKFGPGGEIFFRAREGAYGFAYRVQADGTRLRKAIEYPVIETQGISPDGRWLVVYARDARPGEEPTGATMAFPLDGGSGVRLFGPSSTRPVRWSANGTLLFLSLSSNSYSGTVGRTYVIPLPAGRIWPEIPAGGFQTETDFVKLPGARVIDAPDVAPGPTPGYYAFSRETIQRNLYRIPLP